MLARAPPPVEKLRVALREMGEKEVVIFWRYNYVLMEVCGYVCTEV